MGRSIREKLIAVVTFLAGAYFFLEFVLPDEVAGYSIGRYHEQISNGFIVVGAMAFGLGLINLLLVHGGGIVRGRKGWPFSAALLSGLGLMMFFEIAAFVESENAVRAWQEIGQLATYQQQVLAAAAETPAAPRLLAAERRLDEIIAGTAEPEEALYVEDLAARAALVESLRAVQREFFFTRTNLWSSFAPVYANLLIAPPVLQVVDPLTMTEAVTAARTLAKEVSDARLAGSTAKRGAAFLYQAFFVPLGAAMFSLLAFYVASAAYRTFRIRSAEAAIMMTAALVVMLGQIPHGPLYISPNLVPIRLWLLQYLSTPAFRAIFFGAAIAGLAMAVRMWLSLERSPLESED